MDSRMCFATPLSHGPQLRRELTLVDALSIVIGIMIGSGIFLTPGLVLVYAGSVGAGLLVWIAAGVVALCSALLYAELGSSIPVSGGDAEFFKNAFGGSWSFSYIWTLFFVLYPGGITVSSSAFAQYFIAAISSAEFKPQDLDGDDRVKYIAIICVVTLTICNCVGVRFGAALQNVLSLCKAGLVVLIILVALVFLTRDTTILEGNFSKPFVGSTFLGFGPSMIAALWAFSGWGDVVFLTEELKNPTADLPRACFGAIFVVTGTYLFVNFSYLSVLPSSDIRASVIVAMDATKSVLGHKAGSVTAILVAISILGSINASILCGGRYLFSAARDGQIYSGLGQLSHQTSAPIAALTAQGVWCVFLLLLSSDFVKLLNYFGIASFFFYGLSAAAHWKLRHRFPGLQRPFMSPFHPCLNILVICVTSYMIVTSILADPVPTILSSVFILSSFPVYFLFVKNDSTPWKSRYLPILS